MNLRLIARDMAQEMCDSEILVKISGGIDLVAIEGKYLSCLIKYLKCYRAFSCAQQGLSTSSSNLEKQYAEIYRVGNRRMEPCFQVG